MMNQTPVTTQPEASNPNDGPPSAEVLQTETITSQPLLRENGDQAASITEVTATFHPANADTPPSIDNVNPLASTGLTEEEIEEQKEKKRQQAEDCCCLCLTDEEDIFCCFYLCQWIGECFRGIGVCTESCFECCGDCLNSCCEDSGDAQDSGDCAGCLDCCTSCDCDCND